MADPALRAWRPANSRPRGLAAARVRAHTSTRLIVVSVVALVVLIGLAVLVPLVTPGGGAALDLDDVYAPPAPATPFGTDGVGRDLFARSFDGLRTSLLVGAFAAVVASAIGIAVGALAGATANVLGGVVDAVLMRLIDALNSLPHLVLGIFIVAMLRPSVSAVIISIGVTHWATTARLVRAEMLSLNGREFVDAAIAGGSSRWRVTRRHLLPHVAGRALLAAVLMVPHAIWHESALSFLGLGMPPHLASLGTMIEESQGAIVAGHWWPSFFPGLLLVLLTLAVSGAAGLLRNRVAGRAAPAQEVTR